MSVTIEAVYEAGVFKPLTPLPEGIREHEKVRLVVQAIGVIAAQRQRRIQGDAALAQEIGESPDFDLFEG